MMNRTLVLSLFAASLAPAAHAAVLPGQLPALPAFPVSLPGAAPEAAVSLKPVSLPLPAAPSVSFPGVANPLPLPMPAILTPVGTPVSSALPADHHVLDWSFLDGDDALPVVVPNDPGPKPLPPAGAGNQLEFATTVVKKTRVGADPVFDGARSQRPLVAIPVPAE